MSKKSILQVVELYLKNKVPTLKLETIKQMSEVSQEEEEMLKDCQILHTYGRMSWYLVNLKKAKAQLEKKTSSSKKKKSEPKAEILPKTKEAPKLTKPEVPTKEKKSKDYKAAEAKKMIEKMSNGLKLRAFILGDARTTVLTAYEKQLKKIEN